MMDTKRLEEVRDILLEKCFKTSLGGDNHASAIHAGAIDIVDMLIGESEEDDISRTNSY